MQCEAAQDSSGKAEAVFHKLLPKRPFSGDNVGKMGGRLALDPR